MNIAQKLQSLYPNALPLRDFRVRDDGNGEYIEWWNTELGQQPSEAQIDAQAINVARKLKRKELILAFDTDYEALWSIDGEVIEAWKDRILFKTAANRTVAENNKLTQAAALFDKLQAKLAYLKDPVRTEVEVNALTWASTP